MVRAFCRNPIERGPVKGGDCQFLQASLVVETAGAIADRVGDVLVPQPQDQVASSVGTAVEIDRTDHGFECVGKDGLLVGTTGGTFAFTKQQRAAQVDLASDQCQGRSVDNAGAQLGELPLGELGIVHEYAVSDCESQHGIAQKLQALVGLDVAVLGTPRTMG